ncbi:Uncharacterized protein GBIM_04001 [Gryllus bimaculatus]|nr:Uncharacterized protein GBIM_04001 [Gryllus bimaculatus]
MPKIRYYRCDSDEVRVKNRELFTSIRNGDLNRVKSLLEWDEVKTNVTDKNNKDNTPLHYAVERNKKEIIEELLQPRWETEINRQNEEGNTPLHIASYGGNKELVQLLLENNADPGVMNNEKKTPLEIARLLNLQDVTQMFELYILLTPQASIEQLSNLQPCSETNSEEGKSNVINSKSTSFAQQEADNSWTKRVQGKGSELAISQNRTKEIQQNESSFHENERRRKLLTAIAQSSSIEVKHLIEEGVDVNFEDENGNTPLGIAMKCKENEIIKILGEKTVHNSFEIIKGKSEKCILSHSPKKEEMIEEKIRKKVKFSLDALIKLTGEKGDIKNFTHKNVNIFVLFLEAFALQDVEINNKLPPDKKNELIVQYFGKEDNDLIKDIRENFVKRSGKDRENKKIISPMYLQNFVPKINGKWDVELFFCNLQDYVQGVHDKLSGLKQSELNKKDLKNILQSNSMQKIKGKETVSKLFHDFVKEAYSEQPEQQEKVMFDLTVNIIPLFDEELKEGFEELRNLRHELIHNFYMYRDPTLRLKEFKRAIFDLRSKLFKYYSAQEIHNKLCHARLDEKIDGIIDNFSKILESLEEKFQQDFLTLSEWETTGSFEHVFSELLFSVKDGDVEDLVEKYLRFFAVIDDEKRRQIDNEEESEISDHCRELSDVERREIFEDFVRLEEIKECDDLYQLKKEDLKEKFGKYGIEECYFNKTIQFSLEGNSAFNRENVITDIVKGLMSLKISKELAEYKILNQDIISIYSRFIQEEFKGEVFSLNNHKDLLRNYFLSENAKQFIERKLRNLIKKEEVINIPSEGLQINIAKVVNNILKTFYNAYHKYQIKFDNIEAAFSDKIFLDFLVSQDVEKISNLGPGHYGFKFKDNNYIYRIIKKLLKKEYTAPYISNLITKTQTDEVIEEDDLRRLIEILFKKNRYIIYLSELLYVRSEKPNFNLYEVVYEIFEKSDINAESMQILLASPKHARELISLLYKKFDVNDYIPDKTIETTKIILKILNDVILELIYKSKNDKALEILAGIDKNDSCNSPGLILYKKLENKGFIDINDNLLIDYQLNIVKAKNAEGQEKTRQKKPKEARVLYEEALKILEKIPANESPKSLLALSRKAYTHTLLENYDDSYKECHDLYKLVIKIALGSDVNGGFITKDIFNQIKKSVNYEDLLSASDECRKYLNIISIKKSIAYNEFKQGVRKSQDEAIMYFEKALTTCKEILNLEKTDYSEEYKTILPTRKRIILIHQNIGQLCFSLNEYLKALWYFYCALQEATIVFRRERDILGIWGIGRSMRSILDKLNRIAISHNKLGEESSHEQAIYHYNNALYIYKKVYSIQKDIFGEEHKGTIKTQKSIAFTLIKLGESSDKQEALECFYNSSKIYEQVYEIQKDLLGEEHEDTLKTNINIAFTFIKLGEESTNKYEVLGHFYNALTIYDKTYKIQKDIGKDDKDSSKTLNNILKTKNHIAFTLIKLGEEPFNKETLEHFNKALDIYEELYDVQKEIFGEEHSDTLKTKISIAGTYNKLGNTSSDKQEALIYFNNALTIYEKIHKIQKDFGKDHEDSLRILNNILRTKSYIAYIHNKLAEESCNEGALVHFKKALAIYEELFNIQKDLFGEEHADSLRTKINIAFTYTKLGNESFCKKEALEHFMNALNTFCKVYKIQKDLGKDDKESSKTLNNILRTNNNIAFTLNKLSKESSNIQEALVHFYDAVNIFEKINKILKDFGEDDEDCSKTRNSILWTKNNIAFMHNKLGEETDCEEALKHFNKALVLYEEIYVIQKDLEGEDHEDALKTQINIAFTYNRLGNYSTDKQEALVNFNNALTMYNKIYKIQTALYKDHEDNLKTLNNILRTKSNVAFTHNKLAEESSIEKSLEHLNKALAIYKELHDIQKNLLDFGWMK